MKGRQAAAYSSQLVSLQEAMVSPQPRARPSPDSILQFLIEKESLIGSVIPKASMGEKVDLKASESLGFLASVTEGVAKLVNKKSTK